VLADLWALGCILLMCGLPGQWRTTWGDIRRSQKPRKNPKLAIARSWSLFYPIKTWSKYFFKTRVVRVLPRFWTHSRSVLELEPKLEPRQNCALWLLSIPEKHLNNSNTVYIHFSSLQIQCRIRSWIFSYILHYTKNGILLHRGYLCLSSHLHTNSVYKPSNAIYMWSGVVLKIQPDSG